jgi:pyruvate,water dikinase
VWWVQARPITGLESVAVYSNRISKEVMPGIIKPLVWSINVPVVNRAWIQLFTEAIGRNRLHPDDLAKSFGYRSYFNMGAIGDIFEALGMPRESLELLIGLPPGSEQPRFKPTAKTFRKLPRLITFALRKARFGRRADVEIPDLEATYRRFDRDDLAAMSDAELVGAVHELMELGTRAAYINIVVPLLANLYATLLRKPLEKREIDLAQVDLMEGVVELEHYDPNPALERLGRHLAAGDAGDAELDRFLERFGHLSDSGNDFSMIPWREQRNLVARMAQQHSAAAPTSARITWDEVERSIGALARPMIRALGSRARTYRLRREEISYIYTYGYGLFRPYFLELGRRLAERGLLDTAEDAFYLDFDEVQSLLDDPTGHADATTRVAERKAEIDRLREVEMPPIIYGDDYVPTPASEHGTVRRGVGTSRGHYRGPLRVVAGIADFDAVATGDVIAIPYSDVGWSPLFAKAGAVIAESGGMLSHSSIVAREYGIPCVVSVPGATRLASGSLVTVDGYTGVVTIED